MNAPATQHRLEAPKSGRALGAAEQRLTTSASKPFDCKGNWDSTVAAVNKTADIQDPLARNAKITSSYASMYSQDPNLQWAGLGAVVSRNAGCAMVKAQAAADSSGQAIIDQQQYSPEPAPDVYNTGRSYSASVAHDALADTNQTIYRTVAPTMSFVAQHGAKQLKACMDSGAVPVQDHLADKVSNEKLANSGVPPQLSPAVDKLAQAEALPDGDPQRVVLTKFASDDIANYEQTEVVQQRIYNPSWQVRSVFQANQWLSERPWGRDMGATAPEVALSSDCNATDRIPFTGNIGNATDRVQYYKDLMSSFGKLKPQAAEGLMTDLKAEPRF